MSKQIKISDGLVISREWLETYKKEFEDSTLLTKQQKEGFDAAITDIIENSTPLTPVVEKAIYEGKLISLSCMGSETLASMAKETFLNGKIEINE